MITTPLVYFLSGMPGAGKTTVGPLLADQFEKSVFIEGDAIQHSLIVRGLIHSDDAERASEAHAQLLLRYDNCAALADNFVASGFTVVVDSMIAHRDLLMHFTLRLHARPLAFVTLAPPLATSLERDRNRKVKQVGSRFAHLHADMTDQLGDIGLWLDNSNQTPSQTVQAILARTDEALI